MHINPIILLCIAISMWSASRGCAQNLTGLNGGFSLSSASVAAGTQVTVTFGILNASNTPAGASSVRFYLSKDASIDPATDFALTGNLSGIPALGPIAQPSYTIPVSLPPQNVIASLGGPGAFHIGMVVDSANQVNETNEGDNRNQGLGRDLASLTVTIPPPDLAGADSRVFGGSVYFRVLESSANWGDIIRVSHAVVNNTGGNSGPFNVKFYLSPDLTIGDSGDYVVFTRTISGIPGQTYSATPTQSVVLPSVNPFGTGTIFYVGMVVDADNEVAESNESNNKNLGSNLDRNATTISITPPTPSMHVTDSASPNNDNAVAFDSVANDGAGNARGVQKVTIVNKGKASLNTSNLALTGSPHFSLVEIASSTQNFIDVSSLPRVIAPNGTESWVITLQYDPAATGAHAGTLTITSNDPTTPALAVALTGTGSPVPDVALATAEAVETDFGSIVQDGAGGFTANRTITLKNVGTGPLTVNQNGVSLLTGTHYSIVSITSSTQGAVNLASGTRNMAASGAETWDVVVKFDPTTTGLLKDGLKVLSNDPDEASFTASLTGTGVQPMRLAVSDSNGSPTDRAIAFSNVHADGTGKESNSATVTLTNTGEAALSIPQNGLTFVIGTHFKLGTITSSTAGTIDLSAAAKTITGGSAESWTVTLLFDPSTGGALTDTLRIASNDPSAPTTTVSLTGTGLTQPALSISDSVAPSGDLAVAFGAALNDGAGNRSAQQTVTIRNMGTQPLVVSQNGISLTGSASFQIASIVSSTAGTINVGASSASARTLAPAQAETWTVSLSFDPTTSASLTGTLDIASNDPVTPIARISLTGQGSLPTITLLQPASDLNLSAGSVFNITWQDSYPAGEATIALYLDADQNPATGLIPITTGLSSGGANFFAWRPDAALIGGSYYLYATITDGSVAGSSYTSGRVTIDATGAFKLRSSQEVTSADYAFEYEYNGQVYTGVRTLTAGSNLVTVTTPLQGGGTATNQFTVNLVPSLTHVETQTHDQLNRVETTKNGNGIVTTITYNQMGLVSRRSSSNGAVVDFSYDVLGRNTSMTDYTGSTFYEWDELSRLTAVIKSKNATKGDGDDLKLSYEFNIAGLRTAVVYPGGERVEYSYDDAGRMKTVNNVTHSLLFTYTYNPATGQLTKLTRPNGIETVYFYNGAGQLTTIRHQRTTGSALMAEFFYTLDAAGKATELRTTLPGNVIRREGFGYDRFDRLNQVIYADDGVIDANDKTVIYSYDPNGNRLTQTTKVNNVVTEVRSYAYGNENRLLKVTDQTGATIAEFRYDSAGNRIQKITPEKTTNYSYDERNLMVSYNDGINSVTLEYDGSNQRISSDVNGTKTTFINNPSLAFYDAVEERDKSGAIVATSTFGGSKLVSRDSEIRIPLEDRLGSAPFITNSHGDSRSSFRFDSFGQEASAKAGAQFATVNIQHGTDLYFMRARFYDPETGSFISKDPLGVVGAFNQYQYADSNPLSKIDPNGTSPSLIDQWLDVGDFNAKLILGLKVAEQYGTKGSVGVGIEASIADISIGANGVAGRFGPKIELETGISKAAAKFSAEGGAEFKLNWGGDYAVAGTGKASGALTYASGKTTLGPEFSIGDSKVLSSSGGNMFSSDKAQGKLELKYARPFSPISSWEINASIDLNKLIDATLNTASYFSPKKTGSMISDFGNPLFSTGSMLASAPVGGVLLDKAATLVGSNLSDLRGAVYDPVTGQFVFLGTEGSAAVKDINLDYLYTALQAVYGSAVPPFVTLDPPASAYTQWTDFGNGNGVFEIGEKGGFFIRYNPIWPNEDTTVDVTVDATWNGTDFTWTARFNCEPGPRFDHLTGMWMVFNSWVNPPPTGVTLDTAPWQRGVLTRGGSRRWTDYGLDSFTQFTMNNASSRNYIVNRVQVYPAKQHRKFGGRIEGTSVGWVMLEADRVMKCLSVGKDNLTGASYNSGTVPIAGYQNMIERQNASGGTGGNIRLWFTPKEMTLKRHVDPVTARASIVFDSASVACNTESFLVGLPQPPEAKAFADHLTANYDAFANLTFPCVDYNDPTGTAIINVKIFDQLRDVMRAVSLARFFRDNNVPVDMWWLNSWQPPYAYSPKSTPTAYNTQAGLVIYGGVQVNKPNAYVPSASAKSVADVVQSSRPDMAGNAGGDLKEQVFTANTVEGNLKAVATSVNAEPQDGAMDLAEVDLSFASPGALPLQFVRFYQSSWLGKSNLGPGWRVTPFVLEFQRPSWYDDNGFMIHAGQPVYRDLNRDTRLRSGGVRVVDLRSGGALDFNSSLQLSYGVDNIGNTVISLSGLDSNGVPTFTSGQRQSGATLTQLTDTTRDYKLTTADGAEMTFDFQGRLLTTKDKNAKTQTYAYDTTGALKTITDSASQVLTLNYDANAKLVSVVGPASEQVNYTYTPDGCLYRATHVRSGAYVQYSYNANCQLNRKTRFNGLDAFQTQPDLKGRQGVAMDARGNTANSRFTQDATGTVRTTTTSDPLIADPAFQPTTKQMDRAGRVLMAKDATGATTSFGYDADSLAPNAINLPIAGRPTIKIERNELGQPTRIVDPGNVGAQDVTATYDPATKQLRTLTDPSGAVSEVIYDANKRVQRARSKLNGVNVDTVYGYAASGALRTITNPLGKTVSTFGRDALDRVTSVTDATGVMIGYKYDSLGRLWKITDPRLSSEIEYIFDDFDRVIEVKTPSGSIFYGYDPAKGWLNSTTDILGRVTSYERDPATGDILKVIEKVPGAADRVTSMTRTRFGQLASLTPPGAAPITFNYDSIGRAVGTAETSTVAPGAPKALDSDRATDGVATYNLNHRFTWGAPESDSGIAGYSYALDAAPADTINTTSASATWNNVTPGTHTFQVKAKSNDNLWGGVAVFRLIVLPMTPYEIWRRQQFTESDVQLDSVSGPIADPDNDGITNLMEYALNSSPNSGSIASLPKASLSGNRVAFTFRRNVSAVDLTLRVESAVRLFGFPWTNVATKTGNGPWIAAPGFAVSEEPDGSVSVSETSAVALPSRKFLRLSVAK